ncbi:MAG: hypothetical protein ACRD35_03040 [Candidatus Acidiferrales bacterium]
MANCPQCGSLIDLDVEELEDGEILSCPECAVELEVVNTHPLELDVIEEEDEEEADGTGEEPPVEEEDEDEEHEEEEGNGYH